MGLRHFEHVKITRLDRTCFEEVLATRSIRTLNLKYRSTSVIQEACMIWDSTGKFFITRPLYYPETPKAKPHDERRTKKNSQPQSIDQNSPCNTSTSPSIELKFLPKPTQFTWSILEKMLKISASISHPATSCKQQVGRISQRNDNESHFIVMLFYGTKRSYAFDRNSYSQVRDWFTNLFNKTSYPLVISLRWKKKSKYERRLR